MGVCALWRVRGRGSGGGSGRFVGAGGGVVVVCGRVGQMWVEGGRGCAVWWVECGVMMVCRCSVCG